EGRQQQWMEADETPRHCGGNNVEEFVGACPAEGSEDELQNVCRDANRVRQTHARRREDRLAQQLGEGHESSVADRRVLYLPYQPFSTSSSSCRRFSGPCGSSTAPSRECNADAP